MKNFYLSLWICLCLCGMTYSSFAQNFCPNDVGNGCDSCPDYQEASNPDLLADCQNTLTMAIVVDESNSIANANAQGAVEAGVIAFLEELECTPVEVAVIEFGSSARYVLTDYEPVADILPGMQDYFDGVPINTGSFNNQIYSVPQNGNNQEGATNWQAALQLTDDLVAPDLLLFFTDGIPTAYLTDPTAPGSAYDFCGGGSTTQEAELYNAVQLANNIKNEGTHMFVLGVGGAATNPAFVDNVEDISDLTLFDPNGSGDATSIGTADYAIEEDFDALAECLTVFANNLCPLVVACTVEQDCDNGPNSSIVIDFANDATAPFTVTIGNNAPIITNDDPYTVSGIGAGTYTVSIQTGTDCEREGNCDVTVDPLCCPTTGVYIDSICIGGTINVNGMDYGPGMYTQLLSNAGGCDSTLNITINGFIPNCEDNDCNTENDYDPSTCQCINTPIDPPNCDDGDCNTADSYDSANCVCVNDPIDPPNCDDGDCNTADSYDSANCVCVNDPIDPPNCDDGDCNTADSYDSENCVCVNDPIDPPNCDDGDCNTADSYDSVNCVCVNDPIDPPNCDDGDCNTADSYDSENCICVNAPIDPPNCDDGCPLTTDVYDEMTCSCSNESPDPDDGCPLTTDVYDGESCTITNTPNCPLGTIFNEETCSCDQICAECPDDIEADCNTYGGAIVHWEEPTLDPNCPVANSCEDDAPYISGFIYAGTYNGSHYYCSTNNYTWEGANMLCQNNGGFLTTINDANENAFIQNFMMASSAWIGYNDVNSEGNFEWVSGENSTYTNWQPGQPNNLNNIEHYTRIRKDSGKWTDKKNNKYYECVMEIPCEDGSWQQTSGPTSGSFFGENTTTTITYEYTDSDGNYYTCSFDITVDECDFDCVQCPEDITFSCHNGGAYINLPTPSFDPSCGIEECTNAGGYIHGFVYIGEHNGSHYYCSANSYYTWHQANYYAQAYGGHLVVINDANENNFIQNAIMQSSAWIGLHDTNVEGDFEWVNNDPLNYQNWYPNQPNDYYGQDYTQIFKSNGLWADYDYDRCTEFVMEVPCDGSWEQINGPADGSWLPSGSTETVVYEFTNNAGDKYYCSYDVSVETCSPCDVEAHIYSYQGGYCPAYNVNTFDAVVSGGTPPFSYMWQVSGNCSITGNYYGPSLYIYNYPGSAAIYLTVTDANGCVSEACYYVQGSTYSNGYREDNSSNLECDGKVFCVDNIYPTITKNKVYLDIVANENLEKAVTVYSSTGAFISEQRSEAQEGFNQETVDLSNLPTGVYHIKVQMKGEMQILKVVKE